MSASRVERLPFTVYDIMGYFAPGAYLVFYFITIFSPSFMAEIEGKNGFPYFSQLTIILITAYVVGHVAALMSSESIERLWVAFIGYPSKSSKVDAKAPIETKEYVSKCLDVYWSGGFIERAVKCLLFGFFILHVLTIFVIVKSFLVRIVIKPLSSEIWRAINSNFEKIFNRSTAAKDSNSSNSSEDHNFKIIDHYIFSTNPNVANRQYNYVTIYGFCRNMCFATYVVFLMYVVACCLGFASIYRWDEFHYFQMGFNMFMSLVLFVAFIKFFRRYTYDALLAFAIITDTEESQKT